MEIFFIHGNPNKIDQYIKMLDIHAFSKMPLTTGSKIRILENGERIFVVRWKSFTPNSILEGVKEKAMKEFNFIETIDIGEEEF